MMPARVAFSVGCLFAMMRVDAARADEGEAVIGVYGGAEAAWLLHPAVHEPWTSPFQPTGAFAVLPRLGLEVGWGMTNQLTVGLLLEGSLATQLRSVGVLLEGARGDLITGTYGDLAVPVVVRWRLDSGGDVSAVVSLASGAMFSAWAGNVLVDPKRVDGEGRASLLPVSVSDTGNVGGLVRLAVGVEARAFEVVIIAAEPYVTIAGSGSVSFATGLSIRGAVLGSAR